MKVGYSLSAIVLAQTLVLPAAHAARSDTQQALLESGTLAGAAVAGTALGGPLGFVVGALGGAFIADQSRNANNADKALEAAGETQQQLAETVAAQRQSIAKLERDNLAKLTFQVLFATGEDRLNDVDLKRVAQLAEYLNDHPGLQVSLHGHADPRGTDEYNNVLSQERALAVKAALESHGIAPERINSRGHGNRLSTSNRGDTEAYRQDRRVDIDIESPAAAGVVAQH